MKTSRSSYPNSADLIVRRPTRISFTSRYIKIEVLRANEEADVQVIPLSSLSLLGHGRLDGERVSWGQIAFAGALLVPATPLLGAIAFVLALGDSHSFGLLTALLVGLPYLGFVALLGYKVLTATETGLLIMNDAGYARLFVSDDHEAIDEMTESVASILDDPDRYRNTTFEVSIDGRGISGSLVFEDHAIGGPAGREAEFERSAHRTGHDDPGG